MPPKQAADAPRKKWWRFRFSLRSLLVVVFLAAAGATLIGLKIEHAAEQKKMRMLHVDALRTIWQALVAYEQKHGTLPPAYVADEDGQPMHSWRILLLPFLGEQALFDRYSFDEPWNGPHNIKLADQMPKAFQVPGSKSKSETAYFALTGVDTAWLGAEARTRSDLNATHATVLLVESSHEALWLEPCDVTLTQLRTSSSISTPYMMFADGRVSWTDAPLNPMDYPTIRKRLTAEARKSAEQQRPSTTRGGMESP